MHSWYCRLTFQNSVGEDSLRGSCILFSEGCTLIIFGAIIRMSRYFKNTLFKLSFYLLVVRISFKSDICCLSENCVSNTFLIFRRSLSYQAPVELLLARLFFFPQKNYPQIFRKQHILPICLKTWDFNFLPKVGLLYFPHAWKQTESRNKMGIFFS